MVYQDLAFCTIEHVFKRLDDDDYFGYIPLRPSNEGGNQIELEKCGRNRHIKKKLLAKQKKYENSSNLHKLRETFKLNGNKKLDSALEKAITSTCNV